MRIRRQHSGGGQNNGFRRRIGGHGSKAEEVLHRVEDRGRRQDGQLHLSDRSIDGQGQLSVALLANRNRLAQVGKTASRQNTTGRDALRGKYRLQVGD